MPGSSSGERRNRDAVSYTHLIIAGNWKMNKTATEANALIDELDVYKRQMQSITGFFAIRSNLLASNALVWPGPFPPRGQKPPAAALLRLPPRWAGQALRPPGPGFFMLEEFSPRWLQMCIRDSLYTQSRQ